MAAACTDVGTEENWLVAKDAPGTGPMGAREKLNGRLEKRYLFFFLLGCLIGDG